MDSTDSDGLSGVFCTVSAERLQYGYTAFAVQELDFSVKICYVAIGFEKNGAGEPYGKIEKKFF